MRTRYDVYMDNLPLSAVDPAIYVTDVQETQPAYDTTAMARARGDGSRVTRRVRDSLQVRVYFAVRETDVGRRRDIIQRAAAWAMGGRYLAIGDRPGQRLRVVCDTLPSVTSALRWTQDLIMVFTAYAMPYWEADTPIRAGFTGTSGTAAIRQAGGYMRNDIFHLAAIRAGIHIGRSSHRSRNAAGKFQAAERVIRRRIAQLLQRGAALRRERHAPVGQGDGIGYFRKELSQLKDQASDASVPYEQIAAVSQHAYLHAGFPGRRICAGQLLHGSDLHQYVRRASQFEGGVAAHGRVFKNLLFGYGALQRFQQLFTRGRVHQTNLPLFC